ncbi:MAG TPA: hypothetical protein VE398_03005 [Acidobacteriota bacterium]|nr:hypothetical protein [Acidobacteriota bacterium]
MQSTSRADEHGIADIGLNANIDLVVMGVAGAVGGARFLHVRQKLNFQPAVDEGEFEFLFNFLRLPSAGLLIRQTFEHVPGGGRGVRLNDGRPRSFGRAAAGRGYFAGDVSISGSREPVQQTWSGRGRRPRIRALDANC